MKKMQLNKKLSFDKLTIAKLSNEIAIKGGSGHSGTACVEVIITGMECDDTIDTLTKTNSLVDRPTIGKTKCNCGNIFGI